MAKVEKCLKICFIVFNGLFAATGVILLLLTVFGHVFQDSRMQQGEDVNVLILLYSLGITTIVVSSVGIYGVVKEKKWAMFVFLIMMSLGCVGLLWFAVPAAIVRPKISGTLKETFEHYLPLNEAPEQFQTLANYLQTELQCCGLFKGYKDWGKDIPDSCHCPTLYQNTNKCEATDSSSMGILAALGVKSGELVYKQSCFPLIEKWTQLALDVFLGIAFGFVVLTLLGLVMSCMILYQIAHSGPSTDPVMFSVNSKLQTTPKYSELHNI
ncbi:tetraspanin-8-like isoform X1 [Arapaima gigas]